MGMYISLLMSYKTIRKTCEDLGTCEIAASSIISGATHLQPGQGGQLSHAGSQAKGLVVKIRSWSLARGKWREREPDAGFGQ